MHGCAAARVVPGPATSTGRARASLVVARHAARMPPGRCGSSSAASPRRERGDAARRALSSIEENEQLFGSGPRPDLGRGRRASVCLERRRARRVTDARSELAGEDLERPARRARTERRRALAIAEPPAARGGRSAARPTAEGGVQDARIALEERRAPCAKRGGARRRGARRVTRAGTRPPRGGRRARGSG